MKQGANETWSNPNGSVHFMPNHSKAADKIDSAAIEPLSNKPI